MRSSSDFLARCHEPQLACEQPSRSAEPGRADTPPHPHFEIGEPPEFDAAWRQLNSIDPLTYVGERDPELTALTFF